MRLGRLEVSSGALLVAALLLYLDRDGILLQLAISCGLHELGHWGAIRLLGGRVRRLRISCAGAELRLSQSEPLSEGKMLLAALAGPAVNFCLCVLCGMLARRGVGAELYLTSALNFGLGSFNLLPVNGLDGGWAARGILCRFWGEETAARVLCVTTWVVALALSAVGAVLMWQSEGRSFSALLIGGWLLACQYREQKK